MKLTVALRVIGGFGIISLLLLIIGVASYVSLNNISASTAEVNQVSIPALENSALMQQVNAAGKPGSRHLCHIQHYAHRTVGGYPEAYENNTSAPAYP